MIVLRKGDNGPEVVRLQQSLNNALIPSPKLVRDGDFGDKTLEAVKRFQQERSLKPDGVVGPQTWTALGQKFTAKPTDPDPTPAHIPVVPPTQPNNDWMATAIAELGVSERSLPGKHNQRIVEYHRTTTLRATDDETPWCSSFVNWVITQSGYTGTNNAAAKSWMSWHSELKTPQYGAIVVIKSKKSGSDKATGSSSGFHVGFWVSQTNTHFRLLGGNQSNQVKYSNFSLSGYDIKAIRWP